MGRRVRRGSAGGRPSRPSTRLRHLPVGPGTRPTTTTPRPRLRPRLRPPGATSGRTRPWRHPSHLHHHSRFPSVPRCRNDLAARPRPPLHHRRTPDLGVSPGPITRGPNHPEAGRCRQMSATPTPAVPVLKALSPAGPNRQAQVTSSRSNRRTGNHRGTSPPVTPSLHRPRRNSCPHHRPRLPRLPRLLGNRPCPSGPAHRPVSNLPHARSGHRSPFAHRRPRPRSVLPSTPHRNGPAILRHHRHGSRRRRVAGRPPHPTATAVRVPDLGRRSPGRTHRSHPHARRRPDGPPPRSRPRTPGRSSLPNNSPPLPHRRRPRPSPGGLAVVPGRSRTNVRSKTG